MNLKHQKLIIGLLKAGQESVQEKIYQAERDNKKVIRLVLLSDVEKLFDATKKEFLETEKMVKK